MTGSDERFVVTIVNTEALVVGPDEVLIVKMSGEIYIDPEDPDHVPLPDMLANELARLGLADRSLVISGADVEFAKVKR